MKDKFLPERFALGMPARLSVAREEFLDQCVIDLTRRFHSD